MSGMRPKLKWVGLCAAIAAGLVLGGCDDWGEINTSRNFNELIPRFMNAANTGTPEEAATKLFDVTNADERRDAIGYLETKKYGHEPPYMRAYEMLTTDPSPLVRGQALRALGTSHKPEAVEYLVKGLHDKEPMVRHDAAWGLATTFGDEAVAPLAELLLKDDEDAVRVSCARALVNTTNPEATRALIGALEDRDAGVAYYARQALWQTTQQDFGYDGKAWLTWFLQVHAPATGPASAPAGTRP